MARSKSLYPGTRHPHLVMAGLVPAIHVFAHHPDGPAEKMDARNKSGHDEV